MKKILLVLVTFIAFGAVAFAIAFVISSKMKTPTVAQNPTPETSPKSTTLTDDAHADLIDVTSSLTNVSSPLGITGKARGNWFFEASFPVKLYDGNNVLLAEGTAQAVGDWMTTDFVPFALTLPFTAPTTATGTLVLSKDNPSGLPANDDSLTLPVTFAP